MQIEIAALIILGFWLIILTFVLISFLRFFSKLTKGVGAGDLKRVFESILQVQVKNKEDIIALRRDLERLEEDGSLHIQKIGLVRFNPFRDLGGEHSFTLAILDGKDTGVIITGLHSRERTRIYMKGVKGGKSEYELSEEERKALSKAQKS